MIYYLSPDRATANRLRQIYTEIDEVNFEGWVTAITDEHRHMFRFFTYDDDWTNGKLPCKSPCMLQNCNIYAVLTMLIAHFR